MSEHDVNIKLSTQTNSFAEVNNEITSLKLLIGLIATKLPPDCREHLLEEAGRFGNPDMAKMLAQFFPK